MRNFEGISEVALRCRHFHGSNAIPPKRIERLINIYDRIIKMGFAFHTAKTPLPCKGKRVGNRGVLGIISYYACFITSRTPYDFFMTPPFRSRTMMLSVIYE